MTTTQSTSRTGKERLVDACYYARDELAETLYVLLASSPVIVAFCYGVYFAITRIGHAPGWWALQQIDHYRYRIAIVWIVLAFGLLLKRRWQDRPRREDEAASGDHSGGAS